MTPEKKIARGNRAKALINDETLQEAFRSVEDAIVTQWKGLPVSEQDTQHKLKVSLSLLGNLEANLKNFIQEGEYEEFKIRDEAKPAFLGDIKTYGK